jgi:hypothetical protein
VRSGPTLRPVTTPTGSGQQPEYPRPDDQSSQSAGSSSYGQPAGSGQPWDAKPAPDHTQQFPAQGYGQPGQQNPGQQGYQNAPAGYDQGAPAKSNGLGIAALVLGILSIPAAFIFVGLVFGILAIVFGIIGLRRVKARRADNKGMAIAGLVTGIIGLVLSIIVVIGTVFIVNTAQDCIDQLGPNATQAQLDQCAQDALN